MNTPRLTRRPWLLPLLALACGCSSTGGLAKRGNDPDIQTIAAIGDRPVVAKAGSTSSAVADLEAPRKARSRDDRVSGRVVDADGEPVPNATVRVADAGLAGGRVADVQSDRAGGFTLRGLRPGSSYTIIAEYQEKGGWVEGRAEAHVPTTGVEIAVKADAPPADRRRAARPPAGRTVSERIDDERDGTSSRVNKDDLPVDRDDGEVRDRVKDDDQSDATPARKSPTVMVAGTGNGWHASRPSRKGRAEASKDPSALDDRETLRASTHPLDDGDDPLPRARRRVEDDPPSAEDDEENPLPPAIEPVKKRGRGDDADAPSAARPRASRRVSDASQHRPGPPPGALSSAAGESETDEPPPPTKPRRRPEREPEAEPAPAAEADALPPAGAATRPDAGQAPKAASASATTPSAAPASEPAVAAPTRDIVIAPAVAAPAHEVDEPSPAVYDPFPAPKKPATWADLSGAWGESKPWTDRPVADVATAIDEPRARPEPVRRAAAIVERPAMLSRDAGPTVEACRFDARRQQIVDFRLPDLDGRPVTLGDVDADYILLDFWGTWCRPCLMSVPHLVEIQNQFAGRSVAVLGIACEDGPASASAAHVADVAKRLGINYKVLVSSKDESASPLQEALHVSAFPTMVLLDRNGRIVWRDQGATTATLARLDRILTTSTKPTATARR